MQQVIGSIHSCADKWKPTFNVSNFGHVHTRQDTKVRNLGDGINNSTQITSHRRSRHTKAIHVQILSPRRQRPKTIKPPLFSVRNLIPAAPWCPPLHEIIFIFKLEISVKDISCSPLRRKTSTWGRSAYFYHNRWWPLISDGWETIQDMFMFPGMRNPLCRFCECFTRSCNHGVKIIANSDVQVAQQTDNTLLF